MTTKSNPSIARDLPIAHHGSVIDNRQRLQSAAVQGASNAFIGRGDNHEPKPLNSTTYGARAAAISAGYSSRQKSVSPPKAPTSTLSTPPRSQSASTSQVQQLVKGFEQSTGNTLQTPGSLRNVYGRVQSSSPSQVAARVASSNSSSSLRAPLPLRSGGKDIRAVLDTAPPWSIHELNQSGSELQSMSTESTQQPNYEPTVNAARSIQPITSAQKLPAVLGSEQKGINDKESTSANLRKRQLQGSSSTLAAQAAVRKNVSSVIEPRPSEPDDLLNSENVPSEDSDRGREPIVRRKTPGGKVAPRGASIPDQPHATVDERGLSSERAGRSVSEPMAYLRTPSVQTRHQTRPTPNAHYVDERTGITEVSLADAIVASSLASSRAPSPAKNVPAPPPPRRSSLSRTMFRHRHSSDTDLPRHVVPHQGMRQTLRKNLSDENEDENSRRNHRHFIKHPNKHREGSRKRWKDRVTERERKRYEGVWAANKGIFLTSQFLLPNEELVLETSKSELVLDLVVRDIWNRSRLPTDALAEIWDLVDRQGVGTLTRDEFVLGLWLIDQRLRGRKLPTRVSPTLWASVRHAQGLKIPRRL
jgi:hypothetical protein